MTGEKRRTEIQERIHELLSEYANTWSDEMEPSTVVAFYSVAELAVSDGSRRLLEVGSHTSRYQALGMLFASLYDPRWHAVATEE